MRVNSPVVSVFVLALIGLLGGCQQDGGQTPTREGQPVPIMREFKGQQGSFPDRAFQVIQRQEAWQALWNGQPPADIDFSRSTVLAAMMGRVPAAGYELSIVDVRATGERVIAYVTEKRPRPDEVVAQVISYPYHIVVVPKITTPVSFSVQGATVQPWAIQDYFQGTQSQAVEPRTAVLRTTENWQTFWTQTIGTTPPVPQIDFTNYMTAAVLLGQKPTAGYTVQIISVAQEGERLVVSYRTRAPAPGDVVAQVITSPYAIVIIPTTAMPVVFREVTTRPAA